MEVDGERVGRQGSQRPSLKSSRERGVKVGVLTPPGDCRRSNSGRAPRTRLWPALSRGWGGTRARMHLHVGQSAQAHTSMCTPTHRISRFIHSFMLCVFIH